MVDPNCPRPSRPAPKQSVETDFWAGLFIDLTLRIEWLDQALDAIPRDDASEETVVRLQGYSRALADLRLAIEGVQTQRGDGELKFLFDLAGPLAGFLSRLYAWCGELGDDFERMAGAVRRGEPTNVIFSHKKVNKSYAQFDELIGSVRRANEVARVESDGPDKARIFDERWEELVWATEWVHLAMASSPGN
ncbi:MAG: hypothetical protein JRI68_28035 [Deltaproteobacteria bacterium]|nr:hypothetical protein [Deltaproteobacteria bacterium]